MSGALSAQQLLAAAVQSLARLPVAANICIWYARRVELRARAEVVAELRKLPVRYPGTGIATPLALGQRCGSRGMRGW
jgi:hypothetical protein